MSYSKSYNYSLGLLKILMCFEVICCHFWLTESPSPGLWGFFHLKPNAVPVFMIISFYFFSSILKEASAKKLGHRMKRLLIPYVGWALIYFLFFFALSFVGLFGRAPKISDLGWQLLTGVSWMNPPLWYMADLFVLTFVFFFIFRFFPRKTAFVIILILSIAAFIFQYSGANYACFGGMQEELMYTCGRFAEVIPFASLGTFFGFFHLPQWLSNHWLSICLFSIGADILLFAFGKDNVSGFGYGGLLLAVESLLIFIIFAIVNWPQMNERYLKWIPKVGKYTSGIYCTHCAVGPCVNVILRK